jgi:glycine dehydrogenase subunit 1
VSYVGLTPREEQRMLQAIGVARFEDLLSAVPASVRLERPLDIPGPWSEIELRRAFGGWARANAADRAASFLGGGMYDHYVPAAVNALASRSEFATAYTPYQPEVAQGTLTAIFEFQSMIAELTGCDVANASLYDGATAMVEAALLARAHTRRARVVVAGALHPHYRAVLETYLDPHDVAVVADRGGQCAPEDLKAALGGDVACVIFQHPNFFGVLEPAPELAAAASDAEALPVAHVDPLSLGVLEAPGNYGCAIAIGEGQGAGNYLSYGGPHYGFLAARSEFIRRMPGRIVGETTDAAGNRGYVLTLQTREQHIRREKATSNITTNQTLLALGGHVYLSWLGPEGLRELGETCMALAEHAKERLGLPPAFADRQTFKEFAVRVGRPAAEVVREARARGVHPGYPLGRDYSGMDDVLLVALTEKRTPEEIERLAEVLSA